MKVLSEEQRQTLHRAKSILNHYKEISPIHAVPGTHEASVAGDMIADIQFAMSYVYDYPVEDIESVRIVALDSLKNNNIRF